MPPSAFPVSRLLHAEGVKFAELDLVRLISVHTALKKLLENRGLTVITAAPGLVEWSRSGDGEKVVMEPLFWNQDAIRRLAAMDPGFYVFSGGWHVSAPSKDSEGAETAIIYADPHGNPKVAAGDILAQLATATYAGRPLRYRSNK
jgi:hypothetical protein